MSPHIRDIARRERLVHQIEPAAIERCQVEHVPLDERYYKAVPVGHGTIALKLIGAEVHRGCLTAKGSEEWHLLSSAGTEAEHLRDRVPGNPAVGIEQLAGMRKGRSGMDKVSALAKTVEEIETYFLTFHPAAVLHNPTLSKDLEEDFRKLQSLLSEM